MGNEYSRGCKRASCLEPRLHKVISRLGVKIALRSYLGGFKGLGSIVRIKISWFEISIRVGNSQWNYKILF